MPKTNLLKIKNDRTYDAKRAADFDPKKPGQVIRGEIPLQRVEDVDKETGVIKLAFASDKPIQHYFGNLQLSMKKSAVMTERIEAGHCPVLVNHDVDHHVGCAQPKSLELGKDGIARLDTKYSDSAEAQQIVSDIDNEIRNGVSFGFIVHEMTLVSRKDNEPPLYRADKWEIFEISICSIPADISVGSNRELDDNEITAEDLIECARQLGVELVEKAKEEILEPAAPAKREKPETTTEKRKMDPIKENAETQVATKSAAVIETERANEFAEFGKAFGLETFAREFALGNEKADFGDLREAIKAERAKETPAVVPPMDPHTAAARGGGISPADAQLARAIPRHGHIRNFSGADQNEKALKAFRFGNWFLAGPMSRKIGGSKLLETARAYCEQNGLVRSINESVNADGGFMVPEEFGNDLVDLREKYGVMRQYAKMVPMASDRRTDPSLSGFVPTYFPEEEGEITAGDLDFGQIGLTAKKLAALVPVSNEWNEDSIVSSGDLVAGEIGKAFAYKEDLCGFVGDGTSTYGRILGVTERLKAVDGTIANIAGLKVGAGNAYSELLFTDFEGTVALLPEFADSDNAKWFVSRKFYYSVILPLLLALGGTTPGDAENGRPRRLLGYDVVFTPVMPSIAANSQVCAVLGDLSLGVSMGTRHDTRIAVSEHSRFKFDMLEIRGTERFDINAHGVGDTTNAGPIVGLITAAA